MFGSKAIAQKVREPYDKLVSTITAVLTIAVMAFILALVGSN